MPVFLGYVGNGLLDACAVGNVFASPSARNMFVMLKAVDQGAGVLCLYGNYGGDRMNFEMACEMAGFEGILTQKVLVRDDVASSPNEFQVNRRGVAGMVYAFKVAGAAAEEMMCLEDVTSVVRDALANILTMGVALTPCIIPDVGKETFAIAKDEMEIGMGIHGEPGIEVSKILSADKVALVMLNRILEEMPLVTGDEVSVMINGLGATPLEELLIIYRRVHLYLKDIGIRIFMPHIGESATSMEMAGCSITLFKLNAKTKPLLRKPASTPFYTNENK